MAQPPPSALTAMANPQDTKMLGWTGRGLKAGEAGLERWCPLQAALPTRWVLTPQT